MTAEAIASADVAAKSNGAACVEEGEPVKMTQVKQLRHAITATEEAASEEINLVAARLAAVEQQLLDKKAEVNEWEETVLEQMSALEGRLEAEVAAKRELE